MAQRRRTQRSSRLGVSYDRGGGQVFGGFISFADTLKKSTAKTLKQAKELNVAVTIITGDSRTVAEAIGRQVELVTIPEQVIEASVFLIYQPKNNTGVLGTSSICPYYPEQKLSLITLLKERYTVGFLGEGINDAAALKVANVSLVVKSASDVA